MSINTMRTKQLRLNPKIKAGLGAGLKSEKYQAESFREKPLSTQDHFPILIVVKGE